jgi:hypothetical protein
MRHIRWTIGYGESRTSPMKIIPITITDHGGKGWRHANGLIFAARDAVVPVIGAEFAKVAVSMPIAFIRQPDAEQVDRYLPVAVMSPVAGRNLFIGPVGEWLGAYVPAVLRSYPFRLGAIDGSEQRTLCIDEDSGLIVDSEETTEAFFDATGAPAPSVRRILDFLLELERNRGITETAVATLAANGLIQPWDIQLQLDGQATAVGGLFRVDEATLETLDDETFLRLRRSGALVLAYLQLLSMGQAGVFNQLNLAQQQLAQAQQQHRRIESLDEIFATASRETLKFH